MSDLRPVPLLDAPVRVLGSRLPSPRPRARREQLALPASTPSVAVIVLEEIDDPYLRASRRTLPGVEVVACPIAGDGRGAVLCRAARSTDACAIIVVPAAQFARLESGATATTLARPVLDGSADLVVVRTGSSGTEHRPAVAALHLLRPVTRAVSDPLAELVVLRRRLLEEVDLRTRRGPLLPELLVHTRWERVIEVDPVHRRSARPDPPPVLPARDLARVLLLPPARPVRHNAVSPAGVAPRAPARHRRPAPRLVIPLRAVPPVRLLTWLTLLGYLALQVHLALTPANGPFLDEGIYVFAGLRTLDGYGILDEYGTWLAGSLLWPVAAGGAWSVGGLTGARILAAVLVTVGIALAAHAARVLSRDDWTAFVGTAAVLSTGAALALGHLAVYDSVAVLGLGAATAGVAHLGRTGRRGWVVLVAAGSAVAVLGKYPTVLLVAVLLAVLVALRRRAALVDVALVVTILGAVGLMYYLPHRDQLAYFLQWRLANDPDFGVTRQMIADSMLSHGGVVAAVALVGFVGAPRGRRVLALLGLAAMALFPLYHVFSGNMVGATKHLVLGLVVALPVIGMGIARLTGDDWLRRTLAVVGLVVCVVVGHAQMQRLDRSWVDVRPAAAYLAGQVRPGDQLLISNAWPFLPALHDAGVADPATVTDAYEYRTAERGVDVCAQRWVVDTPPDNGWPAEVLDRMRACGGFVEVHRSTSTVQNPMARGGDATYPASVVVYRRVTP